MRISRGTPRKLADPLDRGGRHAGDSFATTDEAQALVRPELDAHLAAVQPGGRCYFLAHPVAVRAEARGLAHHGRVERADCVAAVRQLVTYGRQEVDAARVLPLRVGVGEVVADVAESGSAQQR